MSDEPTPVEPVEPAPDPTPDPAPELGKDGTPFDPERAQRTIEALRAEAREAKQAAKERDALALKVKEFEDAQKSETDKLNDRIKQYEKQEREWQREKRTTNLRLAVFGQQTDLQLADPDLALAALNTKDVTYDDDGEPTNVRQLLEELLERKPILRAATKQQRASTDASAGTRRTDNLPLNAEQIAFAQAHGVPLDRYAAIIELQKNGDVSVAKVQELINSG